MGLFWLSFVGDIQCDNTRFLGVSIVESDSFIGAIREAHSKSVNPGGQCKGIELSASDAMKVPPSYQNRLLTRAECEALNNLLDATS